MAPPLVQLSKITLTFGGKPLLDGADLSMAEGERVCLVGRNGSGKSTLLKIAAGLVEADAGTRFVQPGLRIGVLAQEPDFSAFETVLAFASALLPPEEGDHAARALLDAVGLRGDENPRHLSGGEARRAALAQVLAPDPDILLLDEPTNHLDLPAIEWLEGELQARRCAMVLISHDRRFLERLSRATVWLERGSTRRLERGFGAFEAWRDSVLAEEETMLHKMGRKIVEEEHWLRYGVTARRKRNERRLANLHHLRAQLAGYTRKAGKVELAASEAEKGGKLVLEAKGLTKSFGAQPVVQDFSLRVVHGDRIGLVGPNGAGKTTLVSLLTGFLAPDAGQVRFGTELAIARLEQNRDSLEPETTLKDALTGGGTDTLLINGQPRNVMGYLKDFLFPPERAHSPLKFLSGGERARLLLARALVQPSNLLILDEPTNDLDLETLDVLQEMLADYAGTVLLISHDRDFLDRVVSKVIVPEGKGRWQVYAGGYSDMLAQRAEALGDKTALRGSDKGAAVKAGAGSGAASGGGEAPSAGVGAAPKKLTLQQKAQLESIPAALEKLENVVLKLNTKLADPDLYSRERKAFDEANALLAKAQAEIARLEETWLVLAEIAEAERGAKSASA